MIRWCAYCQKFLGEAPPYDEYSLTHGVCASCKASAAATPSAQVADQRALGDYFQELREATRGTFERATSVLDRGLVLGLAPLDLMMGMLQPALYDIGRRWELKERRVHDEHRLTALASSILELAVERRPEFAAIRQSTSPAALLLVADGNAHTLGIRVVEYLLLDRGLPVFTIAGSLPLAEAVELARTLRPRVVGVSVSMEPQLAEARALYDALCDANEPEPLVLVGGYGIRAKPPTTSAVGGPRLAASAATLHEFLRDGPPSDVAS